MKLLWGVGLFLLSLVGCCLGGLDPLAGTGSPPPVPAAPQAPPPDLLEVGTIVTLTAPAASGPGVPVLLYRDRGAWTEAVKVAQSGDEIGLGVLLLEGSVLRIASGTPARVLGRDVWYEALEVRVLSGPHVGAKGLVPKHLAARG